MVVDRTINVGFYLILAPSREVGTRKLLQD